MCLCVLNKCRLYLNPNDKYCQNLNFLSYESYEVMAHRRFVNNYSTTTSHDMEIKYILDSRVVSSTLLPYSLNEVNVRKVIQ